VSGSLKWTNGGESRTKLNLKQSCSYFNQICFLLSTLKTWFELAFLNAKMVT